MDKIEHARKHITRVLRFCNDIKLRTCVTMTDVLFYLWMKGKKKELQVRVYLELRRNQKS